MGLLGKATAFLFQPYAVRKYIVVDKELLALYLDTWHFRFSSRAVYNICSTQALNIHDHVHIDLVGPLRPSQGFTLLITMITRTTTRPQMVSLVFTTTAVVAGVL